MGVPAVNVMQQASLLKNALHAANNRPVSAKSRHFSRHFPLLSLPLPPRRRRLARLTAPVASKRRAPASDAVASVPCKAPLPSLQRSPFDPATGAAPASGMEPQQLLDPPNSASLARLAQVLEDLGVDYREAAASLELLYSESPSLEADARPEAEIDTDNCSLPPSSPSPAGSATSRVSLLQGLKRKKDRKDLAARITLHRKRLGESLDQQSKRSSRASTKLSSSVWSPAASELLLQYDGVVNLTAQNWSKLGGELLKAEEEKWLASLMKAAKGLMASKEMLVQRLNREPSNDEWAQAVKMDAFNLSRHLALYQAARNKLVKSNLRLVKHQARKYQREATGSSLTVVELCQEGVKGLITAVDRFNPAKGVRFSTYAVFWIRNSIVRAQTRSGYPIRAPFNFAELKMSINKARWEMRLESGEESTGKVLKKVLEQAGVDEGKYKAVMRSTPRVVSLQKRDSLTGAELIERLADPRSHHNANTRYIVGSGSGSGSGTSGFETCDPSLRLGIDDVLDSLEPKESLVLRQRFGLDGKGERSLGEIGRNMCISREMVRRYESRGLLKLQHPARLAYLRTCFAQD